jgi:hypothetical protein
LRTAFDTFNFGGCMVLRKRREMMQLVRIFLALIIISMFSDGLELAYDVASNKFAQSRSDQTSDFQTTKNSHTTAQANVGETQFTAAQLVLLK